MRRPILPVLAFAISAQFAVGDTARAQDTPPSADAAPIDPAQADTPAEAAAVLATSVFDGDFLIVGAGVVSMPSHEGADERTISPLAGVFGRIGGIAINPRAAGIALDFVPEAKGQRVGFGLGPVVRYRANRNGKIKDPVVARLGKLDAVVEGGVAGGVMLLGVLNAFDRISVGADFRWDISGKGSGRVIAPGITYFTPVSKAQVIGARFGAEFVDGKYARYNYGIDAAGSAASGLPQYEARGGFKEWNVGAFSAVDLSGDFLDGGFAIGAGVQYSRLQGSAAETPIVSIRGRRSQWIVGGGLSYTF